MKWKIFGFHSKFVTQREKIFISHYTHTLQPQIHTFCLFVSLMTVIELTFNVWLHFLQSTSLINYVLKVFYYSIFARIINYCKL